MEKCTLPCHNHLILRGTTNRDQNPWSQCHSKRRPSYSVTEIWSLFVVIFMYRRLLWKWSPFIVPLSIIWLFHNMVSVYPCLLWLLGIEGYSRICRRRYHCHAGSPLCFFYFCFFFLFVIRIENCEKRNSIMLFHTESVISFIPSRVTYTREWSSHPGGASFSCVH